VEIKLIFKNKDMKNFDAFVNYKPCTDCIVISCKLGLWSVEGPYNAETARQAEQKYMHFKSLGKYKTLPKEKADVQIKIKQRPV